MSATAVAFFRIPCWLSFIAGHCYSEQSIVDIRKWIRVFVSVHFLMCIASLIYRAILLFYRPMTLVWSQSTRWLRVIMWCVTDDLFCSVDINFLIFIYARQFTEATSSGRWKSISVRRRQQQLLKCHVAPSSSRTGISSRASFSFHHQLHITTLCLKKTGHAILCLITLANVDQF